MRLLLLALFIILLNPAAYGQTALPRTWATKKPAPPPPPPPPSAEVPEQDTYDIDGNYLGLNGVCSPGDTAIYAAQPFEPKFPGGYAALCQFITANVHTPRNAGAIGHAAVWVDFVVDRLGQVREVQVIGKLNPSCDAEAVRVVRSLPAFKPGIVKGHPVQVRMHVAVPFDELK